MSGGDFNVVIFSSEEKAVVLFPLTCGIFQIGFEVGS